MNSVRDYVGVFLPEMLYLRRCFFTFLVCIVIREPLPKPVEAGWKPFGENESTQVKQYGQYAALHTTVRVDAVIRPSHNGFRTLYAPIPWDYGLVRGDILGIVIERLYGAVSFELGKAHYSRSHTRDSSKRILKKLRSRTLKPFTSSLSPI